MNFKLLPKIPWFEAHSNDDMASTAVSSSSAISSSSVISSSSLVKVAEKGNSFDIKLWGISLLSFVPWASDKIRMPTTVNRRLKRHAQSRAGVQSITQYSSVRFRPYVSKVPWHTGARAFLSQFFPRYGHYCGPNWSSGKDKGSPIWDKRPIDWLDFCCYCHDIGYDTHDQAELLKADLAFLECLERPHMAVRGDAHIAHVYKTMCTSGLRTILIPYRQHLVKLQSGQLSLQFGWLSNMIWKRWNFSKS